MSHQQSATVIVSVKDDSTVASTEASTAGKAETCYYLTKNGSPTLAAGVLPALARQTVAIQGIEAEASTPGVAIVNKDALPVTPYRYEVEISKNGDILLIKIFEHNPKIDPDLLKRQEELEALLKEVNREIAAAASQPESYVEVPGVSSVSDLRAQPTGY